MLRVFQDEHFDSRNFIIMQELVSGRESTGRSVDAVIGIAKDSFADGRISVVSITDNPGSSRYLNSSSDIAPWRWLFAILKNEKTGMFLSCLFLLGCTGIALIKNDFPRCFNYFFTWGHFELGIIN